MDRIEIVFYTDPLCCWSWALLPELLKVKTEMGEQLHIDYCMGGLIKDWNNYSDPLNNVSFPSQMGPVWMDAAIKTGLPIQDALWAIDPPASSYPACIAVKTAGLQSADAEAAFFRYVASAALQDGKNTARPEVLVAVAEQLAADLPGVFHLQQFLSEYNNESSRDAFRRDLQRLNANKIGRFPTLTITYRERKMMMTGYRSYDILMDALADIAPAVRSQASP